MSEKRTTKAMTASNVETVASPHVESIVDTVVRETYRNGPFRNMMFSDPVLSCMNCGSEFVYIAKADYVVCVCCLSGWRDRRAFQAERAGLGIA